MLFSLLQIIQGSLTGVKIRTRILFQRENPIKCLTYDYVHKEIYWADESLMFKADITNGFVRKLFDSKLNVTGIEVDGRYG